MSPKLQKAIELLIERRAKKLETLNLAWFGGEPLVAADVVLRLARHAAKVCSELGVRLSGGLTTNAYLLTPTLAEELISYNQDFYQITLDGYGDGHDEVRRRADGRGTFARIWTNLQALKALTINFEVCLRVHVRRDNEENLHELMHAAALAFGRDKRFRLNFQHLRDMGGAGGKTINRPLTLQELRQYESRLLQTWRSSLTPAGEVQAQSSRPLPQLISPIQSASEPRGESAGGRRADDESATAGDTYVCYAAKPNSLLIRANGRIGKCTVAFQDARNDLGYLADDGTVVVNNDKLRPWLRGFERLDPETVGCPIKTMPKNDLQSPAPPKAKVGSVIALVPIP
jgi:uncharacterized protein